MYVCQSTHQCSTCGIYIVIACSAIAHHNNKYVVYCRVNWEMAIFYTKCSLPSFLPPPPVPPSPLQKSYLVDPVSSWIPYPLHPFLPPFLPPPLHYRNPTSWTHSLFMDAGSSMVSGVESSTPWMTRLKSRRFKR
jgi:hypothetical protein